MMTFEHVVGLATIVGALFTALLFFRESDLTVRNPPSALIISLFASFGILFGLSMNLVSYSMCTLESPSSFSERLWAFGTTPYLVVAMVVIIVTVLLLFKLILSRISTAVKNVSLVSFVFTLIGAGYISYKPIWRQLCT